MTFVRVFRGEWQQTQVAIKICAFMEDTKIKDFLAEASVMT